MNDLIRHHRQLLGIAKTWALASLAGWSDDAHRDLITRHGAVALPGNPRPTASSMNAMQLEAALDDYERRGWTRQRRVFNGSGGAPKAVPAHIAHIVRLWARLGQAGKVTHATRPALLAWVGRQVGRSVPNLDALSVAEGQAVIEALKGWGGR